MEKETFNSKRGLKEVQLKDPNNCENYKEVGCVKDVCDCYTLVAKPETLEEAAERLYSDKLYPMYGSIRRDAFTNGAKWQAEKSYSEKEVIAFGEFIFKHSLLTHTKGVKSLFEQFKQEIR